MRPWSFVHATDIHLGSPRSFRFQPAWNENWQTARQQILELRPELLLVTGDLTRDGNIHPDELEAVKADFDALPFPVHVVPGNMDTGNKHTDASGPVEGRDDRELNVTSSRLSNFTWVFGALWWSFVHRNVRFSGLCDMLAGSGLPEERELWRWLEAQRREPRAGHHVWMTHYPLFIDDLHERNFDITDPRHYHDWYFGMDEPFRGRIFEVMKATGTDLVLSGHVHCRKSHRAEGVRFEIGPSTAFAQWAERWPDGDPTLGLVRYEVSEGGIRGAFVPLASVSDAKGYGPGGHPRPDQRDYSLAWEKRAKGENDR